MLCTKVTVASLTRVREAGEIATAVVALHELRIFWLTYNFVPQSKHATNNCWLALMIALFTLSIVTGVVGLPPNGLVDFCHSAIYLGMGGAIFSHVLVFGEIIYTRWG